MQDAMRDSKPGVGAKRIGRDKNLLAAIRQVEQAERDRALDLGREGRDQVPQGGQVMTRISTELWLAEQRLKTGVWPLFKNGTPPNHTQEG